MTAKPAFKGREPGAVPPHPRYGPAEAVYPYRDEAGEPVFYVCRFKVAEGKKTFLQGHYNSDGRWHWNLRGVERVLYRLPEVLEHLRRNEEHAPLYIVEGEKAVEYVRRYLTRHGLPGEVTCSPMGARKWRPEYTEALIGLRYTIVGADNDEPGIAHACHVAADLARQGTRVELKRPALADEHAGIDDHLAAGLALEELLELEPPPPEEPHRQAGAGAKHRPPSQATVLVELSGDAELFHHDHEPYALVDAGGHREVWRLRAGPFRRWLARRYYDETGGAANAQAVQDALAVLEGRALFAGPEHAVHVRVAEHGGAVWLDLGDPAWRAVEVTAAGWRVVADPPVRFRRSRGLLALPEPVRGGELVELRRYVNVSDADWPLLVAWLLGALRPHGPYPLLALHGEQGVAKSTTARALRQLVDPNVAALRAEPRSEHDLYIAARNGWLVALDNLSRLQPWLSDALCRLATGGGFAARELYSDADEVLFEAQRPLLVTGIEDVVTRGDLLDRALVLSLPRISDEERRAEAEFWLAFEAARPRLLGALLDALAKGLERLPGVQLERLPRMADFARFAVAAEPALGVREGAFLAAYAGKRAETDELVLENSPIAGPVRELAAEGFFGTATELLEELATHAGEEATQRRSWPADAARLSGALRRIAPSLRAVGVELEFGLRHEPSRSARGIALRMEALAVLPIEVVNAADWSLAAQGAVRSGRVVVVEPVWQGAVAVSM